MTFVTKYILYCRNQTNEREHMEMNVKSSSLPYEVRVRKDGEEKMLKFCYKK
jgi:hypothetical protein